MNLIAEWKHILKHAWSFRLIVLSGLLGGAEVVLPMFVDVFPRNVFALLSMTAAIGGAVARVIDQPKMERRKLPRPCPDYHRADYD